jgi:hypothetical protein
MNLDITFPATMFPLFKQHIRLTHDGVEVQLHAFFTVRLIYPRGSDTPARSLSPRAGLECRMEGAVTPSWFRTPTVLSFYSLHWQ